MKLQKLVTPVLLAFVGICVAYLVIEEAVAPDADQPDAIRATAAPVLADAVARTAEPHARARPKVIAYYFHSTQRCKTCLAIESQTHEALTESFATELADGVLEWHAVNTDEPANAHFVKSYELVASSLVLVGFRDGAERSWKNLDRVWEFVHDVPAFKHYVTEQTRAYLEQ